MAGETHINRRFRINMRAHREANGWSQGELSRRLQDAGWPVFHQTTITRIESGVRAVKLDEATVIADVLGVDLLMMTYDVDEYLLRSAEKAIWEQRADLGRQGNLYFQQQLRLRRIAEEYAKSADPGSLERINMMLAETPGDAAMFVIKHTMESQGIESFEEFREFWHAQELEVEKQRREERIRAHEEQQQEGDDDATA